MITRHCTLVWEGTILFDEEILLKILILKMLLKNFIDSLVLKMDTARILKADTACLANFKLPLCTNSNLFTIKSRHMCDSPQEKII